MKRCLTLLFMMNLSIFIYAQNISQDSTSFHQSFIVKGAQLHSMLTSRAATASTDGQFTVGGNADTYYPIAFQDNSWNNNQATSLEIGRSNTHTNSLWNGSLIAAFKFHATNWGHESNFIDADIKQKNVDKKPFIGGWVDASLNGNSRNVIIWLRGATTYYYLANCTQSPIVTNSDIVIEGKTYAVKNQADDYVNNNGQTFNYNLWVLGNSYIKGNVGIGKSNPQNKLDVKGKIRAEEVIIETGWADFVFDKDYKLPSLSEVESHIGEHKHLPGIPSESDVKENGGVGLGEMQVKLLQKIEELTLYMIDQNKRIEELEKENTRIKQEANK